MPTERTAQAVYPLARITPEPADRASFTLAVATTIPGGAR